ncbi:hypothetical protein LTR36_006457 [Oleoguttula mirabilis]|uniref:Uncharacterized protein n=1 Tax=Oleoguttula mirabilis TaxID=1507867 RepID=A0AAV9JVD8_9PEZI|nr:hypothetical protein LTR36_006457 [Oleoguttula mirabilis]
MSGSRATLQTGQTRRIGQAAYGGRTDGQCGTRRRAPRPVNDPGRLNKFADPYVLSENTAEGRDMLQRDEFKPAPQGSQEQVTEQQVTAFIHYLASTKLKPAEIPGHVIRQLEIQQLRQLSENLTILGSRPMGALVVQNYGELDKVANARNNTAVKMSAFGKGAIVENLFDLGIGVDDTDRFNSVHGPGIGDCRHIVLIDRVGGNMHVAAVTAFGGADNNGAGRPPVGQEDEYALLLDEMDTTTAVPPGITMVIRCSHVLLTMPTSSYVRLSKTFELPIWTSVKWSGHADIGGHKTLADAFRYGESHKLRVEGEN